LIRAKSLEGREAVKPGPKRKLITKEPKEENTKNGQVKFRAFKISCFRDENIFL